VAALSVGGGMANTFRWAGGVEIGKSLADPALTSRARAIVEAANARHCQVLLPHDVVVAERLAAGVPSRVVAARGTPADAMILDIGPNTVAQLSGVLDAAKTLLWNGPPGAFESEPFGAGTFALPGPPPPPPPP